MRARFLVVMLSLSAACTKEASQPTPQLPSGPKELREVEPNDTVATALAIKESVHVAADLTMDGPKPDEDLYRLEAISATKVASFEVSGIPGTDVALELLDRDGNHIALYNSEGEGKAEKIPNLNLGSPLVVRVYAAKKGAGGAYTASVTIVDSPPDFEVEPNDRAIDATPLPLGRPVRGLLGDRADEDWYRFEVPVPGGAAAPAATGGVNPSAPPAQPAPTPAGPGPNEPGMPLPPSGPNPNAAGESGGTPPPPAPAPAPAATPPPVQPAVVRLDITGVPDTRLQVEIANQAQAVFYTARSREDGEGIQVRNLALRPGETTYYLTVKSAWAGAGKDMKRGYNTSVPYSVTIAAEDAAGNSELEPNDDPTRATVIVGDGTRQGFLAPKGDLDYFLVRCEKPVLLKVELSGVDRIDSILSLVKPGPEGFEKEKEETLLRANDGGVREGELLVNISCGPGKDALLKVEAAPRLVNGKWVRDQENANDPYRLTVSSRIDEGRDEREPNNTPETATRIELGKPMRGLIHPKKDVDYFLVDLSGSPVKVPLKATVTGILKVDISLGLLRLDAEGKTTLVQRSEKGKGDQPETIRYTVEPGKYVLEVRDTRNLQSNYLDAYQLTVEQDQ